MATQDALEFVEDLDMDGINNWEDIEFDETPVVIPSNMRDYWTKHPVWVRFLESFASRKKYEKVVLDYCVWYHSSLGVDE